MDLLLGGIINILSIDEGNVAQTEHFVVISKYLLCHVAGEAVITWSWNDRLVSAGAMKVLSPLYIRRGKLTSAANRLIGSTTGCTITEKAPTRAFSWLKAATSAFTFRTLC